MSGLKTMREVIKIEPEQSTARLRGLDGLRAVAIVGVMGMHVDEALPGGHLGVSVFFVLSGYIITSSLIGERDRLGAVDLRAFYIRRFARLMPAFYVALLVAVISLLVRGGSIASTGAGAVASGAYVLNIVRSFFSETLGGGLGWTWTLALEEQFYLIWPFVFLLSVRRQRSWALMIAVLGVVIPAVVRIAISTGGEQSFNQIYYGPHTRVSGLMLGCILALLPDEFIGRVSQTTWRITSVITIGLIAAAFMFATLDIRSTYTIWLPAVELASALLVASIVADPPGPVSLLLSLRPIAYVGLISYGIYLWNATIIDTLRYEFGLSVWLVATWIVATVAISSASFHFFEQPIRRRARSFATRRNQSHAA